MAETLVFTQQGDRVSKDPSRVGMSTLRNRTILTIRGTLDIGYGAAEASLASLACGTLVMWFLETQIVEKHVQHSLPNVDEAESARGIFFVRTI